MRGKGYVSPKRCCWVASMPWLPSYRRLTPTFHVQLLVDADFFEKPLLQAYYWLAMGPFEAFR
jgi:hypothetical protein